MAKPVELPRPLAAFEAIERTDPKLELVCPVCRRSFPNTAEGRARAADHWPVHVGKPVTVEMETFTITGTPTPDAHFEVWAPGKAPKLRGPKPERGHG